MRDLVWVPVYHWGEYVRSGHIGYILEQHPGEVWGEKKFDGGPIQIIPVC